MKGWPACAGDRADVDDGALDAVADHQPDRLLHQEERPAHVDREHPVEELGRRVEDRPAVGQRAGVDQHVHASEGLVGGGDDRAAILHVAEVGPDEVDRHPGVARDRLSDGRSLGRIAPEGDESRGAGFGQPPGDGGAEPLGRAGDDADLAIHPVHVTPPRCSRPPP